MTRRPCKQCKSRPAEGQNAEGAYCSTLCEYLSTGDVAVAYSGEPESRTYLSQRRSADEFIDKLRRAARGMGLEGGGPTVVAAPQSPGPSFP